MHDIMHAIWVIKQTILTPWAFVPHSTLKSGMGRGDIVGVVVVMDHVSKINCGRESGRTGGWHGGIGEGQRLGITRDVGLVVGRNIFGHTLVFRYNIVNPTPLAEYSVLGIQYINILGFQNCGLQMINYCSVM
jgi:hypothetical protein